MKLSEKPLPIQFIIHTRFAALVLSDYIRSKFLQHFNRYLLLPNFLITHKKVFLYQFFSIIQNNFNNLF